MKKGLIMALATIFVLSVAGVALADDSSQNASSTNNFTVGGDFKYEFRHNDEGAFGGWKENGNHMSFDLNLTDKIDSNNTAFMRLGGQILDDGSWSAPYSASSTTSGFGVDEIGVKANYGNWNFSLGRQGIQLGQGAIFYSGNDIDPLTYFDGIVVSTQFNNFNLKVIGGKVVSGFNAHGIGGLDNIYNYNPEDWTGVDLSSNIGKVNLGAVYAHKSGLSNVNAYRQATLSQTVIDTTPNANYWGVNFSTKFGDNFALNGEYAKSDAASDSNAYDVSGSYSWANDSFTVTYNSVQGNSVDPVSSNIGAIYYPNGFGFVGIYNNNNMNGYKGFTYDYHHGISKVLGMDVYLMSLKPYSNNAGTDNEIGANLKWSF